MRFTLKHPSIKKEMPYHTAAIHVSATVHFVNEHGESLCGSTSNSTHVKRKHRSALLPVDRNCSCARCLKSYASLPARNYTVLVED